MKNIVVVDIDTERTDRPLIVGKTEDFVLSEDINERKAQLFDDIKTLTEGLAQLIRLSDLNGFHKKEVLIDAVIKHLNLDRSIKPNSD